MSNTDTMHDYFNISNSFIFKAIGGTFTSGTLGFMAIQLSLISPYLAALAYVASIIAALATTVLCGVKVYFIFKNAARNNESNG